MTHSTRRLKQCAVYWAKQSSTGADGKDKYDTPVELRVRWVDVQNEFFDANQKKAVSSAVVYVPQECTLGGVLLLGSLEWTGSLPGYDTIE